MLKHCHSSSVRLQRRTNNLDSISLHSTLTVQSSGESTSSGCDAVSNTSDSSLDTTRSNSPSRSAHSVKIHHRHLLPEKCPVERTSSSPIHQRSASATHMIGQGGRQRSPSSLYRHRSKRSLQQQDCLQLEPPASLSSRASSYSSLATTVGGDNPGSAQRTSIKVFASCLRADIEYKTLSLGQQTTAKDVIWQLLSKFRMKHRDPKLFYLTMEVELQTTARDGVAKKTLVLEDEARPTELKKCNPWGECKFSLQMRRGGLVKIYDSVLMSESQYKCLLISEETSVHDVISILLHCYGLERVEESHQYCMYEQCSSQRYQRKLRQDDRPLNIQALWPTSSGAEQFSFVLKRSVTRSEESAVNWQECQKTDPSHGIKVTVGGKEDGSVLRGTRPNINQQANRATWTIVGGPTVNNNRSGNSMNGHLVGHAGLKTGSKINCDIVAQSSHGSQSDHGSQGVVIGRQRQRRTTSCSSEREDEMDSSPNDKTAISAIWADKDCGEEHGSSGGEEMDTSLSSNDSPTPPLTSTPLAGSSAALQNAKKGLIKGPPPLKPGRVPRPQNPLLHQRHLLLHSPSRYPPQHNNINSAAATNNNNNNVNSKLERPSMSFLYPSPDYESFPTLSPVPSRPYSSTSSLLSSTSTASSVGSSFDREDNLGCSVNTVILGPVTNEQEDRCDSNGVAVKVTCFSSKEGPIANANNRLSASAPNLPPKPAGLSELMMKSSQQSVSSQSSTAVGFHDYENYFYI